MSRSAGRSEARFGCKEIPLARRAPSFYDISCGDGDLNLEPAFFAFFTLAAFFTAILGLWILKAPARALWVPASAALAIAVGTGWGAVTSIDDPGDGTFVSAVITFVVSAVAGGALVPEYMRWLQRPERARAP